MRKQERLDLEQIPNNIPFEILGSRWFLFYSTLQLMDEILGLARAAAVWRLRWALDVFDRDVPISFLLSLPARAGRHSIPRTLR